MNFTHDFRNPEYIDLLLGKLHSIGTRPIRIMEVCGGHTMAIRKNGIHNLIPKEISLLSGPGCPVCVTEQSFIDKAIAYAQMPDTVLLSYGDMIRVPGSHQSLDQAKAAGADVRIIYSTIQALELARKNPDKRIVFAAIGFETTTPGTAIAIQQAYEEGLKNFYVLCAHKTMPQAMEALIDDGIPIDGYIGPGHVCSVTGSKLFDSLIQKHPIPIAISGFEAVDLMQSVLMLTKMISRNETGVKIQYRRLVSREGNQKAQNLMNEVFEPCNTPWRGIGNIDQSGLKIRSCYEQYDAEKMIPIEVHSHPEPKGCLCGSILRGLNTPGDCPLFAKKCTPVNPVGACMVSSEGACQAYYSYQEIDQTPAAL